MLLNPNLPLSKQEEDKKEEKESKSLLFSLPEISKIIYFNQKKMNDPKIIDSDILKMKDYQIIK